MSETLPAEGMQATTDDAGPTDAEIEGMRRESQDFRLPAPAPIPVRKRYYITECEHCAWVGSSEQCGSPDDDDIVCPVCCSSMCGDAPSEKDTAQHGEAVYQRILAAEAERDALKRAAGFKPGPFRDDLSRKVILDDIAGMRPAMVEARRHAGDVQGTADLWTMHVEEGRPGALASAWDRYRAERDRREAAEIRALQA